MDLDRRSFLAEVAGAVTVIGLQSLSFGDVKKDLNPLKATSLLPTNNPLPINDKCLNKLTNGNWITTVMTVDVPNKNKRIYTKQAVEKALEKFQSETMLGCLEMNKNAHVNFSDVSHEVKKLYLDENDLKAEIKILQTPLGKILQGMLDDGLNTRMTLRTAGIAKLGSYKAELVDGKEAYVIKDGFNFISVDIVNLEDAA